YSPGSFTSGFLTIRHTPYGLLPYGIVNHILPIQGITSYRRVDGATGQLFPIRLWLLRQHIVGCPVGPSTLIPAYGQYINHMARQYGNGKWYHMVTIWFK